MNLILIILVFFILMAMGYPVALSMLLPSVLYAIINEYLPPIIVIQKILSSLVSFPLLAIPFFILAGNLMNELNISKKIFNSANSIVGHLKGGVAHANILASFVFAGMSGSAVADAGGLGLIEIEMMNRQKFPKAFSAAVTAASSSLGPIVPPSVMLIIFAVMTGTSTMKLFLAGFIPGIVMVIAMMILVIIIAGKRNFPRGAPFNFFYTFNLLKKDLLAVFTPAILLYFLISGVITPTEIGIVLIFYVLLLSVLYKYISFKLIKSSLINAASLTAQVLFLIACASLFGNILLRENLPGLIFSFVEKMQLNGTTFLLLLSGILLLLGTVMEGTAILTLMVPIVVTVASKLGVDFVHLGLVMVLAIEIGLITPPFGLCCFITSDIAKVPVDEVFRESYQFLVALFIVLILIIILPDIFLYLPRLLW